VASDISLASRREVARGADYRCEYCRIHSDDTGFLHQVDHVVSRKHRGNSILENLAYACILCNRHKGSDIASLDPNIRKAVLLFHPRRDRWADHFRLNGGRIEPISAVGRVTVQLPRLNTSERLAERRLLQSLGTCPAH
jgi:hypothetical protein